MVIQHPYATIYNYQYVHMVVGLTTEPIVTLASGFGFESQCYLCLLDVSSDCIISQGAPLDYALSQ